MAKWYGVRNAPGSRDLNPQQEWFAFRDVLADALGRTRNEMTSATSSASSNEEPTKRRKSDNCDGTDNDWEYLLAATSSHHRVVELASPSLPPNAAGSYFNSGAPLFTHIPIVFYALHLFYENIKIDSTMRSYLLSLAEVCI